MSLLLFYPSIHIVLRFYKEILHKNNIYKFSLKFFFSVHNKNAYLYIYLKSKRFLGGFNEKENMAHMPCIIYYYDFLHVMQQMQIRKEKLN